MSCCLIAGCHRNRGLVGCLRSMSAKGNCYDNAPIESFWGILKNELVYHHHYKTRFEAINSIMKYIELDYSQTRIQQDLGMRSPRQVWMDFYRQAA